MLEGMDGGIYMLWWYERADMVGGVGVIVKEKLCERSSGNKKGE